MPEDTPLTPSTVPPADSTPDAWEVAHWTELQALYHLAADAGPEERTRILYAAGGDRALVARVLALLDTEPEAGSLPSSPSTGAGHGAFPGGHVGPYALLRLIGTGGLGAVYLAERVRGGAIQQSAVKVLSLHAAGSAMEARFLREQQIIATLDHPHITRMLDAGFSSEGQPYLAMEYVEGATLTEHCDRLRLSVRDRIELFLQVCDAVSYAHRMLIVHLDLKPSNILVSKTGEAKLLDFGTSKLVEAETALTTTVLATPAYASPEQLRGLPVTTACDVYGLGAVRLELLSGTRPWAAASAVAIMEHALREEDPPPLSTWLVESLDERSRGLAELRREGSRAALQQRLRGDLTSIVARCLRSRASDRYSSVDRLAEDLRRYLNGRPVSARKRTLGYRAGKFLRRNWKAAAASIAVVLVLITAAMFAYVHQQAALRAGERAERMSAFLYSVVRLASTNYTGRPTTTIPEFLQLGVTALPEFIHDAADQRLARLSLAESMFDNSDYEHAKPVLLAVRREAQAAGDVSLEVEATAFAGMTESELGNYEQANQLLEAAMARRDHTGITPAQQLWIVGFYTSNRYNSGVRLPADAALLQQTLDRSRRSAIPDRELGWALGNLATLYSRLNQQEAARRTADESLVVLRRQPYTSCDQAFTFNLLGDLDMYRNDDAAALANYRAGYAMITSCKGPNDLGSLELQVPLARLLVKNHRPAEAVQLLEPSLPIWRKVVPGNPEIGYVLTTLAQARVQQGDSKAATALAQDALAAQSGKIKRESAAMALTYAVLAQGLAGEGRAREALDAAREADATFAKLVTLSAISKQVQADNRVLVAHLQQP